MTFYEVTGAFVEISNGTLYLTDELATPRLHALTPLDDNAFRVDKPVFFKHGQTFGYDGNLGKNPDCEELFIPADDGETEGDETEPDYYLILKSFTRKGIAYEPNQVVALPLADKDLAQLLTDGKIDGPVDMDATRAGPVVDADGNPVTHATAV